VGGWLQSSVESKRLAAQPEDGTRVERAIWRTSSRASELTVTKLQLQVEVPLAAQALIID